MIGGHFQVCRENNLLRINRKIYLVDEISSRGDAYRLTPNVIRELRNDPKFIVDLRQAVRLMVKSWGWVNTRIKKKR